MTKPPKSTKGAQTTPEHLPQTPPPTYSNPNHDFTLQVVIQMQKDLGALTAKVDRLLDDVSANSSKLDNVRMQMALAAGAAALLGGLIGAGIAIANMVPWAELVK